MNCSLHPQRAFLQGLVCLVCRVPPIWTPLRPHLSLTGWPGPGPRLTNACSLPTPEPQLQCSWQYIQSGACFLAPKQARNEWSRPPPTNQVPLRPHYSHFYLLHAAAVHHLMMLDPASDGAKAGGELLVLLPHLKFRPVCFLCKCHLPPLKVLRPYFASLLSCFGRCFFWHSDNF